MWPKIPNLMARSRIISQQLGLLINFLILLSIAPVVLCRPPTKNIFPNPSLERRQPDDIEPSAGGKVHTITVGRAAHMFKPDSVKAAIGDVIKFEFYPTNHSVIRASFDSPCIPREMMEPNADGFFSGWFPMDKVQEKPPTWSWKVDTNDPVFFYCGGEDSCKYWGMVGVINPSEEQTIEEFAKNAKKAQYQLSPGEPFPDEGVNKPNSPSQKSSKDTLSTGAIVGIALAAVSVVVVFGIIFYFLGKWRNSKKNNASAQNQALLYAQPGAHDGIEVLYSRLPMVQPVAASYYDYSRGDARIGSYYDPPNALHVSSAYMSPGSRYSQTVAGSQKGTPSGSPLAHNRAELRTQGLSPVELAAPDDNR